jgi:5-methylcytosine-specific restriction endonuclease McrA
LAKGHKDKLPEEEAKRRRLEAAKRYRDKNREKLAAWHKKDRAENPEKYRERSAEYRANNAEQIKEYNNRYVREHREERTAYTQEWRKNNPEKAQAIEDAYKSRNPNSGKLRARLWRQVNPERAKAQRDAWAAIPDNKEKKRINQLNRRARKKRSGGELSKGLPKKLMCLQRGKCACCHGDLKKLGYHLDHRIPLALGGEHSDRNIELLCPACNSSKSAKHPVEFMQSRGFLL